MESDAIEYFRHQPETVVALKATEQKRAVKSSFKDMGQFLNRSPKLRELEQILREPNIFTALGITEKEIRHSRVLAWLLDPNAAHGKKSLFLERFLKLVLESNGESLGDYEINFQEAVVECEDDGVDILLESTSSKFVLAIENKIHASQGTRQLEDYRKSLEEKFPKHQRVFVFLTHAGEKPNDPDWIPITYKSVLSDVLKQTTELASHEAILSVLFAHYIQLIRDQGKLAGKLNLFAILNFTRHELRHSDFLAWLLNPSASHGLGDRFLRFVLSVVSKDAVADLPTKAASLDWSATLVRRETENMDLLLTNKGHETIILIENKTRTNEREGQVGGYRQFLESNFKPKHLLSIFLDLRGLKSTDTRTVNLDYRTLLPFFEAEAKRVPSVTNERVPALLASQYQRLLTHHLCHQQKTKSLPPPAVDDLCEALWHQAAPELTTLLDEISTWQKWVGEQLGHFLLDEAVQRFKPAIYDHINIWYRFVPRDFDAIEPLRLSGDDQTLYGRLLMYEFFVIPFGNSASLRSPQLAIDVKLVAAKASAKGLKEFLHQEARKEKELFNRVRGEHPSKFDHLLNYSLCDVQDVAVSSEAERKSLLQRRLAWFHEEIHPRIASFFKKKTADFSKRRC